jgi:hypothetical protein
MSSGIKPLYVFDGKPPEFKGEVVCFIILVLNFLKSLLIGSTYEKKQKRRKMKPVKRKMLRLLNSMLVDPFV